MVKTVKVQEAKTRLSEILHDVERGQEYVISRGGTPVARLLPLLDVVTRDMGFLPYQVPPTFFDPLPDHEIKAWEE